MRIKDGHGRIISVQKILLTSVHSNEKREVEVSAHKSQKQKKVLRDIQ